MKTILNLISTASLAALLGIGCATAATFITYNDTEATAFSEVSNIDTELNTPTDGMFFSTDYVVEEYEAEDGLYIVYTDPDAGLEECHIQVDAYTYTEVLHAIAHDQELVGALMETKNGTFTYMTEPEFEMANASAKI